MNLINSLFSKMIQIINDIRLVGCTNKPILVDVRFIKNGKPKPIVIFSHGFKGFKDWGHFNLVANHFAMNGFVFIKFNFSHNGTSAEFPCDFVDLESFGNNNYLKELDDLEEVIKWSKSNNITSNEVDIDKIYLIGHSRGGAISILKTASNSQIKKLATWAAVSDITSRYSSKIIETWIKNGVIYTANARTKQQMPLHLQFYECIKVNKEQLNVIAASTKLTVPFLIIHGSADEAVNVQDARDLHHSSKASKLFIINDTGHTFEMKHPTNDTSLPKAAQIVVDRTINFFLTEEI